MRADYRKIPKALSKVYFHPLNEEVRGEMSKLFASQTSADPTSPPNPVIENRELSVWGRKLLIPESTSKVARFPFEKLCGEPLSSADYLEITGAFEVIFIEDMPELGIDRKDQARRFITFIDGEPRYVHCHPIRKSSSTDAKDEQLVMRTRPGFTSQARYPSLRCLVGIVKRARTRSARI